MQLETGDLEKRELGEKELEHEGTGNRSWNRDLENKLEPGPGTSNWSKELDIGNWKKRELETEIWDRGSKKKRTCEGNWKPGTGTGWKMEMEERELDSLEKGTWNIELEKKRPGKRYLHTGIGKTGLEQ